MLKILGSIMIIAAGTLAGFMESHKLSLRVDKLAAFIKFLTAAQSEIQFSAAPVGQIIIKHGSGLAFLSVCTDYCENGCAFTDAWLKAVKAEAKNEGFKDKDIGLLIGFGKGFGASNTNGQISHCRLYSKLAEENLKSAKEEQVRKSKLYQMLGIFAGILTSLLLV